MHGRLDVLLDLSLNVREQLLHTAAATEHHDWQAVVCVHAHDLAAGQHRHVNVLESESVLGRRRLNHRFDVAVHSERLLVVNHRRVAAVNIRTVSVHERAGGVRPRHYFAHTRIELVAVERLVILECSRRSEGVEAVKARVYVVAIAAPNQFVQVLHPHIVAAHVELRRQLFNRCSTLHVLRVLDLLTILRSLGRDE